ncbi:hypothetical protein [Chelativorans alearense]|uniref:hypothetical protein n=1 Tax=Chelativorans alearense TaxID=2681495 RepID=UPI0013D26644|nr:hypothetical protein [Chelativorans alearense]
MHKIVILTPVLTMLSVGNAAAFDAAWGFWPSDANSQPIPRLQTTPALDRTGVTSSVGSASTSLSFPVGAGGPVGFSAAQGFGPSDENNEPTPRFQIAR